LLNFYGQSSSWNTCAPYSLLTMHVKLLLHAVINEGSYEFPWSLRIGSLTMRIS
jgi:hypothetical protein